MDHTHADLSQAVAAGGSPGQTHHPRHPVRGLPYLLDAALHQRQFRAGGVGFRHVGRNVIEYNMGRGVG